MPTFLYTRPTERLRGTLSVQSGTVDDHYPATYLDDDQADKPAKLTTPTGAWVRDLGAPTRCDICALVHHNLQAGLDVRLQGNPTNAWTAPAVDLPFSIPPQLIDRFRVNVWLDVSAVYPLVSSRTMQFWRLVIVGTNADPIALGEWAMYSHLRNLGIRNIKYGSERWWRRPTIVHETDFLVRRMYSMGTIVRAVEVEVQPDHAVLAEVEAWQRSSAGPTFPFLIVPHREQDDAWFVVFLHTDQPYKREFQQYNTAQLTFQEMSRGLYL